MTLPSPGRSQLTKRYDTTQHVMALTLKTYNTTTHNTALVLRPQATGALGEVMLSLGYLRLTERLTVVVIRSRDLCSVEGDQPPSELNWFAMPSSHLGGGGGAMGSVEPPFFPQIHRKSPGNGVSDVPDFKTFRESMPRGPPSLSCLRRSRIQPPLNKILDPPHGT